MNTNTTLTQDTLFDRFETHLIERHRKNHQRFLSQAQIIHNGGAEKLGKELRCLRQHARLSLSELTLLSEIPQETLMALEGGLILQSEIQTIWLESLANVFHIEVNALRGYLDDEATPKPIVPPTVSKRESTRQHIVNQPISQISAYAKNAQPAMKICMQIRRIFTDFQLLICVHLFLSAYHYQVNKFSFNFCMPGFQKGRRFGTLALSCLVFFGAMLHSYLPQMSRVHLASSEIQRHSTLEYLIPDQDIRAEAEKSWQQISDSMQTGFACSHIEKNNPLTAITTSMRVLVSGSR